jgi:hypothetical protein
LEWIGREGGGREGRGDEERRGMRKERKETIEKKKAQMRRCRRGGLSSGSVDG